MRIPSHITTIEIGLEAPKTQPTRTRAAYGGASAVAGTGVLHAKAFTLMESLFATSILALAAAALAVPLLAGAKQRAHIAEKARAQFLAQQLMEEILSLPFDDPDGQSSPGPEPGETSRSLFDNIDDYHGLQEPAGQMYGPDQTPITDPHLAEFSRQVSVQYVHLGSQQSSDPYTFARVTVIVRRNGKAMARLVRIVSKTALHGAEG